MMLIPMLMKAALGRREPVDIYGTDYPTPRRHRDPRLHPRRGPRGCAHPRAGLGDAGRGRRHVLNLGTGVGSSVRRGHRARRGGHRARPVPVRWAAGGRATPSRCGRTRPVRKRRLGWAARTTCGRWCETAWAWHSLESSRDRRRGASDSAARRRRRPTSGPRRPAGRRVATGHRLGLRCRGMRSIVRLGALRAAARAAPSRSALDPLDDRAAPLGIPWSRAGELHLAGPAGQAARCARPARAS